MRAKGEGAMNVLSWSRALGAASLVFACAVAACTGSPQGVTGADGGASQKPPVVADTCSGFGFRGPTPAAVVCPGTPSCTCAPSEACCMQAVDSSSGTCSALGACRYFALQCDGPEDCADGASMDAGAPEAASPSMDGSPFDPAPDAAAPLARVCCVDEAVGLNGGGSSCKAASACVGKIACRTDDDCRSSTAAPHCRPADYGTPGVEDRGLDGLIGYCQK